MPCVMGQPCEKLILPVSEKNSALGSKQRPVQSVSGLRSFPAQSVNADFAKLAWDLEARREAEPVGNAQRNSWTAG